MRTDDVREAVRSLEASMDRRFEQLEVRLDYRFASIDQRFVGIETRFDALTKLIWGLLVAVTTTAVGGIVTVLLRS